MPAKLGGNSLTFCCPFVNIKGNRPSATDNLHQGTATRGPLGSYLLWNPSLNHSHVSSNTTGGSDIESNHRLSTRRTFSFIPVITVKKNKDGIIGAAAFTHPAGRLDWWPFSSSFRHAYFTALRGGRARVRDTRGSSRQRCVMKRPLAETISWASQYSGGCRQLCFRWLEVRTLGRWDGGDSGCSPAISTV